MSSNTSMRGVLIHRRSSHNQRKSRNDAARGRQSHEQKWRTNWSICAGDHQSLMLLSAPSHEW